MPEYLVSAARGQDPYKTTLEALELLEPPNLEGLKVLLKPNAARLLPYTAGATTHPMVVAAVIDYCRNLGAAEVAIGESPITGVKVSEAYEVGGIGAIARDKKVPLLDFDAEPYQIVDIPEGQVVKNIKVTWYRADYDFIISIPVMKTHMHTKVTLSVKNMKGMLWRRQKVAFHQIHAPHLVSAGEKELDLAIADMSTVLYPDMAVIDGIIGMEGLGPGAGQPKGAGMVTASLDPLAADWLTCQLMGRDAREVPHLRLAAKARSFDPGNLRSLPENCLDWALPFANPPEKISFRYPGVRVHDKDSCSACQNTLYLFLERYHHKFGNLSALPDELQLALGKGVDGLPKGTVYVGNCCCHLPAAKESIGVPGCPPVASQVWEKVEAAFDR